MKKATVVFLLFYMAAYAETTSGGSDHVFKCVPSRFTLNDQITVKIPRPHPKGWAVKTPDGRWVYLQDPSENPQTLSNLFKQEIFDSKVELMFRVRQLKGTVWKNGKPKVVQVFVKPGTYLLYFADNLGTEPDNTFFVQLKVYLTK